MDRRRGDAIEYLERVADQISAQTANVDIATVECMRAAQGILEYAHTTQADLVAMATHGRGGLTRLLLGSVADDVLHGVHVPLLLYRPPEGKTS
jgi:nucleotide-binding universal stress UspA family protein